MAGWLFSIEKSPFADCPNVRSSPIAEWHANLFGMRWIDELVKQGKAVAHGGDGYPFRFSAMAKDVKSIVLGGPPDAKWSTTLDPKAWETCGPDEWLSIEVWDDT